MGVGVELKSGGVVQIGEAKEYAALLVEPHGVRAFDVGHASHHALN